MTRGTDLSELLEQVIALVDRAAAAVMRMYDSRDISVSQKADNSPVTNADLAANQIIINGLQALTPTIAIVSEESLDAVSAPDSPAEYWLVDPIDGTKEFLDHNGEFTVNVGLVQAGEPVLGVVAAPALNKTYYARRGEPAWLRAGTAEPQQVQVTAAPAQLRTAVSRSHIDDATRDWLDTHGLTDITRLGSSLKITAVADGSVDLSPRLSAGLHEWDLAAADAVLRSAGGSLVELPGVRPLRYGRPLEAMPAYLAGSPAAIRQVS